MVDDRKNLFSTLLTSFKENKFLGRWLLIVLLVAAAITSSLYFPFSVLADAGGWPSPTFMILPTLANFPTATLFPTVDLRNLNQLMIPEATPTATLFSASTTAPSEDRSTLSYVCLPLGVGFLLVLILASLMIMRRR
jgi:hypothetical protein